MKTLRVALITSALMAGFVLPVPAQFKMSKEEIQAAVAAKIQEDAASGATSNARRRGGAAAQTGAPAFTEFKDFKVFTDQFSNQPKERQLTFDDFRMGKVAPVRGGVQGAINRVVKKKITVIAGNRVTDAVTGELLDDAREIRIEEEKKNEYYDDGTHGDLVAGDGQYTRVEEMTGVLGPHNQRIKERLIQAVYEVSRLDAQEFYGHTLMSADNSTRPERNVRWMMVDAPDGRVGSRLSEVSTDKSVQVPNYWDEEMSRDEKIAGPNGWARSFLDEYRVTKGGLDSEFYTPYVPEPPTIPKLPPPSVEGWSPFSAVAATGDELEEQVGGGQPKAGRAGGGRAFGGKLGGGAQGAAESFVNRGAGAGSTSGGYFGGP